MPIDRCPFRAVPAVVALALCAAGAAANPQGGVVKAGSATITPNGSRLDVIQSSQRAVIDWRSFSIGAGGHVDFKQPSAASATLNRVTGPQASAILGRLTANGTVFLVNPNGILIGPGAKIDVGGLVAATANISNENFMAGRYKFDEVVNRNAVIVNRGEITAHGGGLVALVAPGVENSGVIRAELGRVVLASGNRFTLDLFGDKLIAFAVDDKVAARLTDVEGRPLKAYVNQTGRIEADGGSILIAASAAKAVLDNVINTGGVVRATSFAQRGGEIVLHGGDEGAVRIAGTLDASGRAAGASGGSVKVLGAEVVLEAGSRIDVAGDAGGGSALVGGGVQGGGGLPRSLRTVIEADATVSADALARGNGGTVVAWSDGETRFAGALSARGGRVGGDGGFVEVSGKRELAFSGAVDLAAPAGRGGRLLLDPEFLVVDAATATNAANTLRSGGRVDLDATDAIVIHQPIDGRGGLGDGALTLTAGNRITVDNDIVTNDGAVTLRSGAGGIEMGSGPNSVTGGNGTMIYTGRAPITLAATGNITVEHLVTTGAVKIDSTRGSVTVNRDLGGSLGDGIAALNVGAGTELSLKGVRTTGAVDVATRGAHGLITLDGPIVAGRNVIIGDAARASDTTIRLQNDIRTVDADIELNGTTLLNPRPAETGLGFLTLIPLVSALDNTYYETPFVQVSLQTTGMGNVRLRGDLLWDYGRDPLNRVQYLYNALRPSASFNPFDEIGVARERARQDPRATGYYGLNVGLELGTVQFDGKLGMFDAAGTVRSIAGPVGTLGAYNPATGMWVTITSFGMTSALSFGANSKLAVSGIRVANAEFPDLDFVAGQDLLPLLGLAPGNAMLIENSLPRVTAGDPDPGIIGPGPQNVTKAAAFDLVTLPISPLRLVQELPPAPPPAAPIVNPPPGQSALAPQSAGAAPETGRLAVEQVRATVGPTERAASEAGPQRAESTDATRAADLGRRNGTPGLARDAFAGDGPLVPMAGPPAAHADAEYFSQGAFEFAETLSRRAAPGR